MGEKEKQAEEQRIYDELNANGDPATFVKRVARKLKDRQKAKVEAEQKPITLASIPYVQGISEGIRRVLAKLDIHTVRLGEQNMQFQQDSTSNVRGITRVLDVRSKNNRFRQGEIQ